mgnify:CR=1 FL=1
MRRLDPAALDRHLQDIATALNAERRFDALPPQQCRDLLLDELGLPFLDDQDGALSRTEPVDLVRHQRRGDVEHEQRRHARAEFVGQRELLQRADQRVVKPSLHDDAEVVPTAAEDFVQPARGDELPRRR